MSDWSSDVCSSDLAPTASATRAAAYRAWSTTSAASRLRRSSGSEHASAAPTSSTPTDPDRYLRLTRVTLHDGRRNRHSCLLYHTVPMHFSRYACHEKCGATVAAAFTPPLAHSQPPIDHASSWKGVYT